MPATEPSIQLLRSALGWAWCLWSWAQDSAPDHAEHSARDVLDVLRAFAELQHASLDTSTHTLSLSPRVPHGTAYVNLRQNWSALVAFATLDARIPYERADARERAVEALGSLGRKALGDLALAVGGKPYPEKHTRCSVCGKVQFWTPCGDSCPEGHGGADPMREP